MSIDPPRTRSSVPYLRFAARIGQTVLVLAALGLMPSMALAQSTGNVLGRVSSQAEGANLGNALVSVSGTGLSVLSGEEGWYFLTGVPPGRHEISVELLGFSEGRTTVELKPEGNLIVDFQLERDPLHIDGLLVSAEPRPTRNSSDRVVIDGAEIERRQAATVTQLLRGLVPGLTQTVTSGDVGSAAQVRIRGVRSLREAPPLFFVDGIRIGSARFGGPTGTGSILTFLDNINLRDVDRIEILHAAEATTLHGTDAAGGAILIYTKR